MPLERKREEEGEGTKLREEWWIDGECRASAEWPQNGDWDRSCSSCGDATLHREREAVCVKEKGD